VKWLGTLSIVLLAPCGLYVAAVEKLANPCKQGDECPADLLFGLLALYTIAYCVIFIWLGCNLRTAIDNFGIKNELRETGLIGLCAFVPWVLFNVVPALNKFNSKVFPVSTFIVVTAASLAFYLATIKPVRLLRQEQATISTITSKNIDTIGSVDTLEEILLSPEGLKAFGTFLKKEWSNENLDFYLEVEKHRALKAQVSDVSDLDDLLLSAKRILDDFVMVDAPYQINLPSNVLEEAVDLTHRMTSYAQIQDLDSAKGIRSYGREDTPSEHEVGTLFDHCQESIFTLMKTDSLPRFYASDLYADLLAQKTAIEAEMIKAEDEKNLIKTLQS
jgi:hypothetical protein